MNGVNNNKKNIMAKYLELFDKDKASAFNVYLADENGEEYRVVLWDGKERGLNVDFLVSKDDDFEVFPMLDDGRFLIGEKRLFMEVDMNELNLNRVKVVRVDENREAICWIKRLEDKLIVTGICVIVNNNESCHLYRDKIITTFDVVRDATDEEVMFFNSKVSILENVRLEPFDKALFRDNESSDWKPGFFWKTDKLGQFVDIDGTAYNYCISYEGNEDKLTIS